MAGASLSWSQVPPGLHPVDVPQFVAVTFDDNFVAEGMTWATELFEPLHNPAGSGLSATFDGAPVRTSFYGNCVYLEDEGTRQSWVTAFQDGHELANHTVSHLQGAGFTAQQWTDEIAPCTSALSSSEGGVGVPASALHGFRAPFLAYGPELFGVLKTQGFEYDSSILSCWGSGQDGKNCAWPYTLDQGSPDASDLSARFASPAVPASQGLWEAPVATLFVPPDELAAQYGFTPGLRQRIPTDMPAPSFYEPATGRIAGLDITLFVDAQLSATEVLATLKHSLDLRLGGNRAPLIFVGHTHVYASDYGAAPHALDAGERQGAIQAFVEYALAKPMVRMRPVHDIVAWMQAPMPLNGVVTMPLGGAGGGDASTAGAAGQPPSSGGAGGSGGTTPMPQSMAGGSTGGTSGKSAVAPDDTLPAQQGCACRYAELGAATTPAALWLVLMAAGLLLWRRRALAE